MFRVMLKGKIHRATVTEANLHYKGSITIDTDLLKAADVLPYEKVQIVDIDNGSRLETYAIEGEAGSGIVCLNGAAARLVHKGDTIIILSYSLVDEKEALKIKPKIVYVDKDNKITSIENHVYSNDDCWGKGESAINESELKEEIKKRDYELKVLHKITQTIWSTLKLDEVLKRIVEIAVQSVKGDSCFLYLFDRQKQELVLRASKNPHPNLIGRIKLGLGEGITGWVAKKKKPYAVEKNASSDSHFKFFHNLPEEKYQAFLSVPIIYKDEVIGVINIQHIKPHKYKSNQINLLNTIAQQAGGAIENARLYEETKKQAVQVKTLSEISGAIVSDTYLEEMLHLIVVMTAEMMNSKICSIMLFDEKEKELTIKATQSLSDEYRSKPNLKVGQSISGQVVKEKKPITVLDVRKEKGYMYPDLAKKENLVSLLSVPMMVKDRVIGVINSYTSEEHFFTDEEMRILQAVANQAAAAIENTKLFNKALAMEEALETRKSVEKAKGILMKTRGVSEEEAFKLIQKQSMNTRKSMKTIAEAIILAAELK